MQSGRLATLSAHMSPVEPRASSRHSTAQIVGRVRLPRSML